MRRITEVNWTEIAACWMFGVACGCGRWWMEGDWAAAIAMLVLGAFLALIALTDLRAFRIPDQLSLPLLPLGLFATWRATPELLADHLIAGVVGALLLYLVAVAYKALRGETGVGLGDVKLTAAAGAWVGSEGLPIVILLASLGGLVAVLLAKQIGHLQSTATQIGRTRVPFGSLEAGAVLATVLWQLH